MKSIDENTTEIEKIIKKVLEVSEDSSFPKEFLLELAVETGVMETFIKNAIYAAKGNFIDYSIRTAMTNYLKKQKVKKEEVHYNGGNMSLTHKGKPILKVVTVGTEYILRVTTKAKKLSKSGYYIKIANNMEFHSKSDYVDEEELDLAIYFEDLKDIHQFIEKELPDIVNSKSIFK